MSTSNFLFPMGATARLELALRVFTLCALVWLLCSNLVQALHPSSGHHTRHSSGVVGSRRDWIQQVALAALMATPAPAAAVSQSKVCVSGVGDGCADLAGDNAYIRSLQAASAANKEAYAQETKQAYYMKNYPDYFASIDKVLLKKADGTFTLVSNAELEQLKQQNRLDLEIPTVKRGQFRDVTQKPIFVLKEDNK